MILAISVVAAGLAVVGIVTLGRWLDARGWRRSLSAYEVTLPADISDDAVNAWFTSVAAITHRPLWWLLPQPPASWEVVATAEHIQHYLLLSERNATPILNSLRAAMVGVRITESDHLKRRHPVRVGAEATITSRGRPLAHERGPETAAALLTSLRPTGKSTVVVQWIAVSAGTPGPVKQPPTTNASHRLTWLLDDEAPVDTEAVRQQRLKLKEPLLHASVRIGVAASSDRAALEVFGHVWNHLQSLNAPGVRIVRRYLTSKCVASRMNRLVMPLHRWPLLLNTREITALSGFPLGELHLPGLSMSIARQLPPSTSVPTSGLVLATSNYAGMTERHLALRTSDRLRHTYVVGPTGSGKSWLLARMILQDIAAGRGVIAIDVKGDLLRDVAARVDAANHDRLIVIEPSRRDRPIGLNILAHAKSEEARELIVDNVLHIFREIWSSSWGPRTDAVLRATLRTLVEARAQDGSAYTLCEIVPLLTMPAFRRSVVQRSSLAPDLHAFWQRYNRMSDAERAQVVGPTLNKVEAFTSRSAIRLMLGQSTGIDLADVFRERKVVLLSLAKGQLGAETANLLGALCVATLWQSTLARSTVRPERRRAAFAYVDEAQDIVRLPVAMADMLAQARGLGLGLTLANQYVSQLPDGVRTAILSTVRSQLAFQLDLDDARLLEKRFQPLTARDLMGLLPCEIALRPCVNGQTLRPVTGQTLPLGDEVGDADAVGELSRRLYGRPRGQVEDAMHHRLQNTAQRPTLGRERRGGAA